MPGDLVLDVNFQVAGVTPLEAAVLAGRLLTAEYLLRNGAHTSSPMYARPLIMSAIVGAGADMIRLLIVHGVEPAAECRYNALSELLPRDTASPAELDAFYRFVTAHVDRRFLDVRDQNRRTPLAHVLVGTNRLFEECDYHPQCINILLACGSDVWAPAALLCNHFDCLLAGLTMDKFRRVLFGIKPDVLTDGMPLAHFVTQILLEFLPAASTMPIKCLAIMQEAGQDYARFMRRAALVCLLVRTILVADVAMAIVRRFADLAHRQRCLAAQ